MRVSTSYGYDQISAHISRTEGRMIDAQNRVITGRRIDKPSDDASGTRTLLSVGSLQAGLTRYQTNITNANNVLSSTEAAYGEIGELMQQAQTLAIQGGNSTMDGTTLETLASQVQALQDRLVSLGNSRASDGRYIYAGQVTDAKPFSVGTDGVLNYDGNLVVPKAEVGPGETASVGETGTLISDAYDKLTALKSSLRSGDTSALSNARLSELKTTSDSIIAARGDVGRRMNALDATKSAHQRRETELADRASEIGEIDYAEAIVDYTAAQSAYEAALQVASKGFSMGLMDFIR